jgi:type I restriction enzyme R subunit
VQIVVEHFRENVAPLLSARPRRWWWSAAGSEAVRWQLAIDKYIKDQGYKIGTLVAFSGEVNDKESGPDGFTETARPEPEPEGPRHPRSLQRRRVPNPAGGQQVPDRLRPALLCGMYVDKRLAGIQAVQTLSRLNRAHPGKDTTYVLDFVNDPEEVLAAFKTYHDDGRTRA